MDANASSSAITAVAKSSGRHTHQSLQRAIHILKAFSEAKPSLSVSEISQRLNIHKSTVSRILGVLLEERLVWHDSTTGRYGLGIGLLSMAGVALGDIDVRASALPQLEILAAEFSETAFVVVPQQDVSVVVAEMPAPRSVRYAAWIGRQLPLHCTASGKSLLAYREPGQQIRSLMFPLPQYTDRSLTDNVGLEKELAKVAQNGYALEIEEFELGIVAIAAPILEHTGRIAGAISIAGPAFRMDEKTLHSMADPLRHHAASISRRLGFRGLPGQRIVT